MSSYFTQAAPIVRIRFQFQFFHCGIFAPNVRMCLTYGLIHVLKAASNPSSLMPKPIRFSHVGKQLCFQMEKVDRSKLYGYKELLVLDEHQQQCELATLADDGKTLVGKGGTGIGQLTADGKWTDKTQLRPIDLEGKEITPVPSSFAAPIDLKEETTIDDYLDHNIRLVYRLVVDSASETEEELFSALKQGAILKFPYSFRGGLEADVGFLLMNSDNQIFFVVGERTIVEFVGLQQVAPAVAPDAEQEGDLMDFSMM